MLENLYIADSHKRCSQYNINTERPIVSRPIIEKYENEELVHATGECLKKIKSTFFALYNSFFTVVSKDSVVLNCFVNKNCNKDMKVYVPSTGILLTEENFGTNAVSISSMKSEVGYVVRGEHYRKQSKKLTCVAAPIWIDNEIVGYISLSTLIKIDVNGLRVFIESLANNISNEILKGRLKSKLELYLSYHDIDIKAIEKMKSLSHKEKQVMEYIIRAYSYDKIAEKLYISEATVRTYLKRINEKCGTKNRIDTIVLMLCCDILKETY